MYEFIILFPLILIALIVVKPKLAATLSGIVCILFMLQILVLSTGKYHPYQELDILFAWFVVFVYNIIYLIAKSRTPTPEHPDAQLLVDVSLYGACFNFEKGVVVNSLQWDLMLNLPNGLASNSAELNNKFRQGGIYDLGAVNFDDINKVSDIKYLSALGQNDIIEGHCYLVKTSTGQKFAKILITQYNKLSAYIKFKWQLADDSQYFTDKNRIQSI